MRSITPLICAGMEYQYTGHGEHQCVRLKDGRGDGVEVVVERTGFAGLVAGFAGAAAANLQHGGVKAGHGMPFGLRRLDEGVGHGKTIAVFARAAGDDYDLFAHEVFLLWAGLTLPASYATIIAQMIQKTSTHIQV